MKINYQMHEVNEELLGKWQKTMDLIADLFKVQAALIMRVHSRQLEVLVSSHTDGSPYQSGEKTDLGIGLYCETVMATRKQLLIPNALEDDDWKDNPNVKLNMISYLGLPLTWPTGKIFGTICVLDKKTRNFSKLFQSLLWEFKKIIEVDFSNYVEYQHKLRKQEEILQAIFDNAPAIMFLLNENMEVIKMNQTGLMAAGPSVDSIVGLRHGDILNCVNSFKNPNGCGFSENCKSCKIRQKIDETFAANQIFYKNEAKLKLKENNEVSEHTVLFSITMVNKKSPKTALLTIDDITETKKIEFQLQQAQKMEAIGSLAGGIAHDFNNLLSVIMGFSQLALAHAEKGSSLEKDMNEILQASDRAKSLVQQILMFSRQTDHQTKEEIHPIRIDILIKEVIKLVRATTPTSIDIQHDLESKSRIMGNSIQIHQILMNLYTNSVHAMNNDTGTLIIRLKDIIITADSSIAKSGLKPGSYIELSVSDTGSGIAPNTINAIFDPYFTTKKAGEGTGLGLSVVHGIVEKNKGKITVESIMGKGSVFTIYLPICQAKGTHSTEDIKEAHVGTERILFVDDEKTLVTIGKRSLELLGYSVTTRECGVEALNLFRAKPNDFDLVITDMTMPKITGDKLAVKLLKIRKDIPVILCTGFSKTISEEDALNLGIKAFVYKPIIIDVFSKIIRTVLEKTSK